MRAILKQRNHLPGALQRRPVDATFDVQLALPVDRAQRLYFALHDRAIGFAGNPEIDLGNGFGRNDIGARSTADDADIQRDAALQVGQPGERLDLMRQFENRALPLLKVEAGVGSLSCDPDKKAAHTLARGL